MARLRQIEDEDTDRRLTRSSDPLPLSSELPGVQRTKRWLRPVAQHGTRSKYNAGCGCEPCRNADPAVSAGEAP